MTKIKYEHIENIGIELLRKNNDKFYRSKLSKQMERIFIAVNKLEGVTHIEDEYYMKSSTIPDRVYYIYSDQLNDLAKDKIYDVVIFKDELCIWFYSKNAINMIGQDPVNSIYKIYSELLSMFKSLSYNEFTYMEYKLLRASMSIRLFKFISDNYGILNDEERLKLVTKCLNSNNNNSSFYIDINNHNDYTDESMNEFINDIIDKYDNEYFYTNKEYLDSYMILKEIPKVIGV